MKKILNRDFMITPENKDKIMCISDNREKIFLEYIKEFYPECYAEYIRRPDKTEWIKPLRDGIISRWIIS